jgi:hypothetical protein
MGPRSFPDDVEWREIFPLLRLELDIATDNPVVSPFTDSDNDKL